MGASHHSGEGGFSPDDRRQIDDAARALMKRFVEQTENRAQRNYSQGRIAADDDGDLAMAVAADKEKRIVIIDFGKPVDWLGLGPKEVNHLINMLFEKMHELGEIVTVSVGR